MIQILFDILFVGLIVFFWWDIRRHWEPRKREPFTPEDVIDWLNTKKDYREKDILSSNIVSAVLPGHSIYRTRPRGERTKGEPTEACPTAESMTESAALKATYLKADE